MHRAATGAYIGDSDGNGSLDDGIPYRYASDRSRVLGPDSEIDRRAKKGVLFQYRAYAEEWAYDAGPSGQYDAGNGADDVRYGFRFHYNPSTIDFGLPISGTGVNPALILSGQAQSMPITTGDSMPTVRVNLFLNRIEDMALFTRRPTGDAAVDRYQREYDRWAAAVRAAGTPSEAYALLGAEPKRPKFKTYESLTIPNTDTLDYFYGKPNGKTIPAEDIRGIYNRGTGYDLEFLFRTILGKPWPTLLRGTTADLGIAFGLPSILDFNAGLLPGGAPHGNRYLGRVSSISYSHLSFNARMVPIWTQVAIDFMRYPDGVGARGASESAAATVAQQGVVNRLNANPNLTELNLEVRDASPGQDTATPQNTGPMMWGD